MSLRVDILTTERNVAIRGVLGLPGLALAVADPTPAWPGVARAVRDALYENFFSESSFRGAWAALSLAYGRWKARNFPGRKILELTGTLRRSWTDELGDGRIEIATTDSLFISSSVAYGRYHQHGTTTMPARPFIVLSDRQKFRVGQAFHHAFGESLRPSGSSVQTSVRQALAGV